VRRRLVNQTRGRQAKKYYPASSSLGPPGQKGRFAGMLGHIGGGKKEGKGQPA